MPFKHLVPVTKRSSHQAASVSGPVAPRPIHIGHGVFLVVRGLVVIEANHDGRFKLKKYQKH